MQLAAYNLPDEDLQRSSFNRAISSATRLFAFCETKWPRLLLEDALRQIDDQILTCALNVRRVLANSPRQFSPIVPQFLSVTGKSKDDYDCDLWRVMGRIVHHTMMKPMILADKGYYQGATGYFVCDLEVTSDHGTSLISLAGFAISSANELGKTLAVSSNLRTN